MGLFRLAMDAMMARKDAWERDRAARLRRDLEALEPQPKPNYKPDEQIAPPPPEPPPPRLKKRLLLLLRPRPRPRRRLWAGMEPPTPRIGGDKDKG